MPKRPELVHLYPVPDVFLHGYPPVECDVEPATAELLLSHVPPPFTTIPPSPPAPPGEGASTDADGGSD